MLSALRSARSNLMPIVRRHISTTPVLSRESGTLKWFNKDKGFGLIERDDDGSKDVFVHWSGFGRSTYELDLPDGLEVEFDIEDGQKGPNATNLTAAGGAEFDVVEASYGQGRRY